MIFKILGKVIFELEVVSERREIQGFFEEKIVDKNKFEGVGFAIIVEVEMSFYEDKLGMFKYFEIFVLKEDMMRSIELGSDYYELSDFRGSVQEFFDIIFFKN